MSDWPISDRLREYLAVQYELVRVLGVGGMGAVLLGHERALDRPVAIKVLHPSAAADAEARERFRREARTAAKLTHPNIVPLHTFGEVEGEQYFVMGYVEGETLAARLERDRVLSVELATRILAEIADALDYAHRVGTVHRDLKPENILLDAATGRALLTDFGIARETGAASSLTSTGVVVGTPHYMSPEQASGERSVDGRSDIYALGVIAYRMVSGALPFGGGNAREVIARSLSTAPAPLPQAVRDEWPQFAAAMLRALEKAPEHRWSTAADFAASLRRGESAQALGEEFEAIESAAAQTALVSIVGGAAFPLAWAVGVMPGPLVEAMLSWGVTGLVGTTAGLVASWFAARRGSAATRALRWRMALWPPRWWPVWWPRRWRRPGDVWSRLPSALRGVRWFGLFSAVVLIPVQIGGLLWLFSARGTETMIAVMARSNSVVSTVVFGALGVVVSILAVIAWVTWRVRRRLNLDVRQFSAINSLSLADPRWREPRFARLLDVSPVASAAATQSTEALLRELRESGVPLPDGLTEARLAAQNAAAVIERELVALREMVNRDELARLDKRIEALGNADASLRQMLESQRALLVRAEARVDALSALRTRFVAQEQLLHQQLLALRALAPSGGDLSEVTGRLRAANDDLRRLAESLSGL